MRKKLLTFIAVTIILFTSTISVSTAEPGPELPERMEIDYSVSPAKEETYSSFDDWDDLPTGIIPFNLDMIDAEDLNYDDDDNYFPKAQ